MRGMSRVALRWLWLAIALGGACAHAADQEGQVVELNLAAAITVSPEGRITDLAWQSKTPGEQAVAEAIESQVRTFEFEPATRDGQAAEAETTLRLGLQARPAGAERWDVAIRTASTGATAERMGPPQYPGGALQGGVEAEVISDVVYDAQGRPDVLDATIALSPGGGAHRRAFMQSARLAILGWRFSPERVNGQPVAGRMPVPLSFCLGTSSWCASRQREREAAGTDAAAPEPRNSVVRLKTPLAQDEG